MDGAPVTIRLLDPPLHEFLPPLGGDLTEACGRGSCRCTRRTHARHARCRLGLQWPEIYEMQVRAIVRPAPAVRERTGRTPHVEIMHPLVAFAEELRRLRELTVRSRPRRDVASRTSSAR